MGLGTELKKATGFGGGGGFIPGAAASALSFGSDLVGTALQGSYNRDESRRNRRFQQYNINNRYQIAAKDLEKAGLNRILALGTPGGIPSGATASINAPEMGGTAARVGQAASAFQSVSESKKREGMIEQQTRKLTEEVRSAAAQADMDEVLKKTFEVMMPAVDDAASRLADPQKMVDDVRDAIQDAWEGSWTGRAFQGALDLRDRAEKAIQEAWNAIDRAVSEDPVNTPSQTRRRRRRN